MPELVTCPLCGCGILVYEMQLGRAARCIGCGESFVAGGPVQAPGPNLYPVRPEGEPEADVPTVRVREVGPSRHRLPLCPRCHRPVGWSEENCSHCGHLFDVRDAVERGGWQCRRDAAPHRGARIEQLGSVALLGGAVTICMGPVGFVGALGCGVPAWWMARRDLEGMDGGTVDPAGRAEVEEGRNKAVVGLCLTIVCGLFWILAFIGLAF